MLLIFWKWKMEGKMAKVQREKNEFKNSFGKKLKKKMASLVISPSWKGKERKNIESRDNAKSG